MNGVIGADPAMIALYGVVDRIADADCPVLVTGERGTGKARLSRALHHVSRHRARPFVTVSCGAVPASLHESELFGHVKGAFPGAFGSEAGRLAHAEGGTLVLEDVDQLSLDVQVKLLRAIELGEYAAVGDGRTRHAEVRVVASSHVDLEDAVTRGSFRQDLYDKLNVIHLHVPALRDRGEDIALLAEKFVEHTSRKIARSGVSISPAAKLLLARWRWPGNVRELENAIERAVILSPGEVIEPSDLPAELSTIDEVPAASAGKSFTANLPDGGLELRAAVDAFENSLIRQALERTGWNKNQAARLLGLNRTTLVEMLKRKRLATRAA